jgi:hypothetical protein
VPTFTPSRWPIAVMLGERLPVPGTPACRTSIGIAPTYEHPASFCGPGLTGASASEQLPMITVVECWQE